MDGQSDRLVQLLAAVTALGLFIIVVLSVPGITGWLWALAVVASVWGMAVLFVPIFGAVTQVSRWQRRRYTCAFRTRLEDLPVDARAAVLLPLRDEGTVREIVAPLLDELHLPAEIAPAASTDARGDEASPAERAP